MFSFRTLRENLPVDVQAIRHAAFAELTAASLAQATAQVPAVQRRNTLSRKAQAFVRAPAGRRITPAWRAASRDRRNPRLAATSFMRAANTNTRPTQVAAVNARRAFTTRARMATWQLTLAGAQPAPGVPHASAMNMLNARIRTANQMLWAAGRIANENRADEADAKPDLQRNRIAQGRGYYNPAFKPNQP